jgi:hypothetical protein
VLNVLALEVYTTLGTMWSNYRFVQLLMIELLGFLLVFSVYRFAKRGLLSFRYVVGWLSLAMVIILSGPLSLVIKPVSDALHLSQGTLISAVGITIVLIICIQLSISISGIHERQRRASEEISHLKNLIDTKFEK